MKAYTILVNSNLCDGYGPMINAGYFLKYEDAKMALQMLPSVQRTMNGPLTDDEKRLYIKEINVVENFTHCYGLYKDAKELGFKKKYPQEFEKTEESIIVDGKTYTRQVIISDEEAKKLSEEHNRKFNVLHNQIKKAFSFLGIYFKSWNISQKEN